MPPAIAVASKTRARKASSNNFLTKLFDPFRPGCAMNVKSAVLEYSFVRSAVYVGLDVHLIST